MLPVDGAPNIRDSMNIHVICHSFLEFLIVIYRARVVYSETIAELI